MNLKIGKLLVLILVLLGGHDCRAASEVLFRKGVAAYEAGQYEPAVAAFRHSLAEQPAAGTLLNLGLAEWQCGHPGEAMVAWEQSAWLNPFNPDARDNLLYAQETMQVNPLDLSWCERSSIWLPAHFWTWIAGGSLWLAVALVTLPGFFRLRKAGWHQTLAAVAMVIFLLSLPPNLGVFTRVKLGIVTDRNTTLRLTPTQSGETVATLSVGEPIRQLRERGEYFFIHTTAGNGWVGRRQVKFICPK